MRLVLFIVLFFIFHILRSCHTQFINEIRLDETCTTHGAHGAEIAVPRGTHVNNWWIVLYDGYYKRAYKTIDISHLPKKSESTSGWTFVDVPFYAMHHYHGVPQTPDGIALVDNGTVVSFQSHDHTFTAEDGPAHGMTSKHVPMRNKTTLQLRTAVLRVDSGLTCSARQRNIIIRKTSRRDRYGNYQSRRQQEKGFHGNKNEGNKMNEHPHHQQFPYYHIHNFHTHQHNKHEPEWQSRPVTPIINEMHYQKVGWDIYEGVEVAAPAGTSLEGYYVEFYMARSGTVARPSRKLRLGGVVRNQSNGWGFQFFRRRRVRNGPRDGLALVDPDGHVCDFLSYGGVIYAVGGPAKGLISVDIGIIEQKTNIIGYSLQRTGIGRYSSDFVWAGPMPQTYGKVNIGQIFKTD